MSTTLWPKGKSAVLLKDWTILACAAGSLLLYMILRNKLKVLSIIMLVCIPFFIMNFVSYPEMAESHFAYYSIYSIITVCILIYYALTYELNRCVPIVLFAIGIGMMIVLCISSSPVIFQPRFMLKIEEDAFLLITYTHIIFTLGTLIISSILFAKQTQRKVLQKVLTRVGLSMYVVIVLFTDVSLFFVGDISYNDRAEKIIEVFFLYSIACGLVLLFMSISLFRKNKKIYYSEYQKSINIDLPDRSQ